MRKAIILVALVVSAAAAGIGWQHVPELLSRLEIFRVAGTQVDGVRYVAPSEVDGLLALRDDASVWDDLSVLEDRLEAHVLVEDARVRRRFPGTLVIQLHEREPVALVPTPALEPVDGTGVRLPIDPAVHRLDLPILRTVWTADAEDMLPPSRVRDMAAELDRIVELDPAFARTLSELAWDETGAVVARVADPDVELLFHPPLAGQRLRQGLAVLADAMSRSAGVAPVTVDLRFADQVVVKHERINRNTHGAP